MKQDSPKFLVRPAVQAGRFYEADPLTLRHQVERLLAEGPAAPAGIGQDDLGGALALVVPHASYAYSGRVAAAAYRALAGRRLDRVLILGPSHYSDFMGAALPSHRAFATPLGEAPVDRQAVDELLQCPGFSEEDSAHDTEHALEVQLPFLQVVLPAPFEILPVALGRLPREGLAALGDALAAQLERWSLTQREWVIVASTDTYHGYSPEACLSNDELLMDLIGTLSLEGIEEGMRSRAIMACGWLGLALAMKLARQFGARRGVILNRADSQSASAPSGGYVVGYIAAAFV